jgi:hypothetical protein
MLRIRMILVFLVSSGIAAFFANYGDGPGGP